MDLFLKDIVIFVKQYQNTMDMMMYLVLHFAEFVFLCFLGLMILIGIGLIVCLIYDKLSEFAHRIAVLNYISQKIDKYPGWIFLAILCLSAILNLLFLYLK